MDLDGDGGLAERLERLGHLDLPLVDVEALRLQRLRDVRRGHRPVQRVVVADAAADHDLDLADPLRDGLGRALVFHVAHFGELLLALDLALVVLGHQQRELPRQQVVPSVTGRDLHDVATAAQVFDVFSENDFHDASGSTGSRGSRFNGFGFNVQRVPVPVCRTDNRNLLNPLNPLDLVSNVRNQRELARARNRHLQGTLVLRAGARNPARLDLAPLRDEGRQQPDILVVDVIDLLRAELADATPAEEPAARALPLLVLVVLFGAAAAAASPTTSS